MWLAASASLQSPEQVTQQLLLTRFSNPLLSTQSNSHEQVFLAVLYNLSFLKTGDVRVIALQA